MSDQHLTYHIIVIASRIMKKDAFAILIFTYNCKSYILRFHQEEIKDSYFQAKISGITLAGLM